MSRGARGSRRAPGRPSVGERSPWADPARPLPPAPSPPSPAGSIRRRADPAPAGPSLIDRINAASAPAKALLPLRIFFGLTFLYAGIDKLIDPAFFDSASAGGIAAQMALFARVSPLAPLAKALEPAAIPLGLLIALGEIAIGLGALTGLGFRLAAAGGAFMSLIFFLTASWTTHPYYYGPDLPYAFGWLTLAIAGDADLVPKAIRDFGVFLTVDQPGPYRRSAQPVQVEVSLTRRHVVRVAALGAASIAVASLSIPLRSLRGNRVDDGGIAAASNGIPDASTSPQPGSAQPSVAATSQPSLAPGASGPAFTPSGLTVAQIATVDAKGVIGFRVPATAPASLPAGDSAAIIKLKDGSYAAYDLTCTHEGCRVGWDAKDHVLLCPCHGAAFDPENHAAVLGGPTNQPLLELPLVIDKQAGTISLKA